MYLASGRARPSQAEHLTSLLLLEVLSERSPKGPGSVGVAAGHGLCVGPAERWRRGRCWVTVQVVVRAPPAPGAPRGRPSTLRSRLLLRRPCLAWWPCACSSALPPALVPLTWPLDEPSRESGTW